MDDENNFKDKLDVILTLAIVAFSTMIVSWAVVEITNGNFSDGIAMIGIAIWLVLIRIVLRR